MCLYRGCFSKRFHPPCPGQFQHVLMKYNFCSLFIHTLISKVLWKKTQNENRLRTRNICKFINFPQNIFWFFVALYRRNYRITSFILETITHFCKDSYRCQGQSLQYFSISAILSIIFCAASGFGSANRRTMRSDHTKRLGSCFLQRCNVLSPRISLS